MPPPAWTGYNRKMGPTLLYFAYGSNLHPLRLRERAPSARFVQVTAITEHSLRFHKRGRDGSSKCNAYFTAERNDKLLGALYEIDAREKPALDQHEGVGAGYEITTFSVMALGREREVFAYVAMANHIDESLRPFGWYTELVLLGATYHGFPTTYLESIKLIRTVVDTDQARAGRNERILAQMRR
ncbi:MAG: gamma-glutamylcyclotransferase family protein [Acidiferrobacterales bacterium]